MARSARFFAHADATLLENCQQVNVLAPTFNKMSISALQICKLDPISDII